MNNNKTTVVPESYPMNGGDGTYSYSKNSNIHNKASSLASSLIEDAIANKFDMNQFSSSLKHTFNIADLGCSVGPNTFIAMEKVLKALQKKYQSQHPNKPEFHVFFNDHSANDFNTLFSSLPPERYYFAAGVPGSFHGRVFPKSSLHLAYSQYALQWLSKVPEELLDKNSPAWNKGRVHYTYACDEVVNAYAAQFSKDMASFFDARANELVAGGLMLFIIPANPEDIPCSRPPLGMTFDLLGRCLVDMAKEGLISEVEVDSFNLPVYYPYAKEITQVIERNGYFEIEMMELQRPQVVGLRQTPQIFASTLRSALEVIVSKHFGSQIIDELFNRIPKKAEEFPNLFESRFREGAQLFLALKRK
ncbi:hypothetical protein UlMin_046233 [Ulmus minor]